MVDFDHISAAIRRELPDALVTVEDMSGGGDHLQVNVVSKSFPDYWEDLKILGFKIN